MATHRRPRWLVPAATVSLVSLGLAACGSDDEGTDGADGGGGTVVFWSQWEQNEPQAEILTESIAAFTEETGIEVEVEWQGRQVMQRVQPLLRSGDVPDVVDGASNSIRATLVATDQAHDLSDVFASEVPGESGTVADLLGEYDSLITAESMEGPFMVPTVMMAQSLFYNGAEHPDLTAPQDWEGLVSLLDDLKAQRDGGGPVAVDGDIGSYLGVWTSAALISELGEGGFAEVVADETGEAWRAPEVLTALEHVAQLAEGEYWLEGSFNSQFPQMQERWAAGDADLLFMGSWAPQETSGSTTEDFEYRQIGFPAGSAGQFTQADVSGFAIPAEADNIDGAEQLLAWMVRTDVMQAFATDAASLVTRPDLDPPEPLADTNELMQNTTVVRFYDGVDGEFPGYATEVFEPINNELARGEITPQEMVDRLVTAQQDYWARTA